MAKHINRSGFTIVELLIVIVVIAILAAISLVAYNGITNRAKDSAALSNAQQVGKKITVHSLTNGDTLPADLATIGITNSGDTTYQYTLNTNSTPDTFCVTATSNGISAHSAGTNTSVNAPTAGPCTGHAGTSPTTLANGDTCPTGYIVVPGSSLYGTQAFCVMKYEAKIQGQSNGTQTYSSSYVAESRASGTPWVNMSQPNAIAEAAALGSSYHLITEGEWLTIAQNVLGVSSNWSGGSVGLGYIYSGHNDGSPYNTVPASTDDNDNFSYITGSSANQRRTLMLSNGEVIWDLAGNAWEWTSDTITGTKQPGLSGEASYVWKEWNNGSLLMNGLSGVSRPSATSTAAASYSSTQGIGQLLSNYSDSILRGYLRGGSFGNGISTGVLTLNFGHAPSSTGDDFGFRVSKN